MIPPGKQSGRFSNLKAGLQASFVLKLMSLMFRLSPSFRRNIIDEEKGYRFNARIQFRTLDGSAEAYAIFEEGRMKAGRGRIDGADLTFNFKTGAGLQSIFSLSNPADALKMMLENDLFMEGNLMYLAKFGHLSKELAGGQKKRKKLLRLKESESTVGVMDYSPSARDAHPLVHRAVLQSTPHDQVEVLGEPYLGGYRLEQFPRLQAAREKLFTTPAEVCTERPHLLTKYFLKEGFEEDRAGKKRHPGLRQAEALKYILSRRRPMIKDDDLLAGTTTSKDVGVLLFPEFGALALWPELLTVDEREMNPYRISAADIDILNFEVFPFWTDRNVMEHTRHKYGNPRCQQLEGRWVLYFCWKAHAVSHTIPDFAMILQRGLLDIIAEAKRKEAAAAGEEERSFYRALQAAQEGVLAYAANLARRARELADALGDDAGSQRRRRELEEMAAVCERVPAYPARTLHEAVNAIWLCWLALHMENMNAGLSLGRLDQVLQPYFLRDAAGAKSAAEKEALIRRAVELVGCFYLKCSDHLPNVPDLGNRLFGGSSSDQALTLGGVDRGGGSAVCDMTYIFLKVTEMLALREPNVNARFYPGVNSEEYLKRLIEVNTVTAATPSLHNDAAVIPALVEQGFALEDARDWGSTGCVEPTSVGRHMGHTNCMLLNTVAALEMALHDGVHPLVAEQVGPHTGDPAAGGSFPTFDDFKAAYKEQLGYLIDQSIAYNDYLGASHQELHPTPLLSSFFDGPMEKGRDVIDGGARYNTSGAALVSITDVIDSLTAIDELIYREKAVDWKTLLQALEADFSGFEALHARISKKVPKFGGDAAGPRELAQELIDFIYDCYQAHRNYRGGLYTSGFWSMSNHVAFGTLSGALPSGRLKGKPFTPGITPSPGVTDRLLSNIHTIAGLDPLKMPNNIAFNVKVAPGAQDSHTAFVERVTAYAKSYFELGGMQMQFNIVTTEMLKEAVDRPEDYRWLLVRISGYNAYFVELNRDMQQELIERTEFNLAAGN
ncbi:MAG: formate acetyltransferase [Firmicutes bacterium]|nr:formate acetyltransferase [Bacillota bacterium]